MNITKVTISGADDKVNPDNLMKLQQKYPFVEWGILVSTKRMGESRYPRFEWINRLHEELRLSIHLCGQIARSFVDNPTRELLSYANGGHWERTQLNFSFKEDRDYSDNLFSIAAAAVMLGDKSLILAYNKGSKKNIDAFIKACPSLTENIHFLYDSSGGRGSEIKEIGEPLINYTGYAGGLNPDNVGWVCQLITSMSSQRKVWIDMETGVRTNDVFDLKKVESVLKVCDKYIKKSAPKINQ